MTYSTRPLTLVDCAETARFLAGYEKIEDSGQVFSEDDLATLMAVPAFDIENTTRGIYDGDRLVGLGLLLPDFLAPADPAEGAQQVKLEWTGMIGHDQRGQGLGVELLAWAMQTAAALAGPAGYRMRTGIRKADEPAEALLAAAGFAPVRWYFGMNKPLAAVENRAVLSERAAAQLRLAPFAPELSAAVLDCHNAAFADSWGSPQAGQEDWESMIIGHPQFRADLSFLFLDTQERVVSLLLSYHNEARFEQTRQREVTFAPIATRREWRGHGLAGTLMQTSGNRAFELGFGAAVLEVDSENPTGALGVYQKAGFEINREIVAHEFTSAGAPSLTERPHSAGRSRTATGEST